MRVTNVISTGHDKRFWYQNVDIPVLLIYSTNLSDIIILLYIQAIALWIIMQA